jgi:hypothetical protein
MNPCALCDILAVAVSLAGRGREGRHISGEVGDLLWTSQMVTVGKVFHSDIPALKVPVVCE